MTEMFDWNDEKLKDVIWSEASENGDQYPDGNKAKSPDLFGGHIKEKSNHEAANTMPLEQKKPVPKSDFNALEFSQSSWPELCLSNARRSDKDSMVTELSDDLVEVSGNDSSKCGEVAQLDIDSDIFSQQSEDKEESDFIDYGWANIGSFDDLDRIFSKDDQMFGHLSLCNADSMSDFSSDTPKIVETSINQIEFSGGISNHLLADKTVLDIGVTPLLNPHLNNAGTATDPNEFEEKLFSCVQMNEKQLDNQYSTNMGLSESIQYKHFSNNHQYPSGFEIPHDHSNPLNKSPSVTTKNPLIMTPQQKIEKLRKRQQMRAMLAIQKQQQEFNQQDSCTEGFHYRNCLGDNNQIIGVGENHCTVEEPILRRLQDTIAKLDIQMRLCIRDSLFRLAQSAIQRKNTGDKNSINKRKRDINNHNRFGRIFAETETDTNPIDRTVANLLFQKASGVFINK